MTLEGLSSNDLLNLLLYETLSPTPFNSVVPTNSPENDVIMGRKTPPSGVHQEPQPPPGRGRKRRRRKPRLCKNKEEAETQRMTHIAVERNRRRQMNQHLSALRSLMPQSYAPKRDQASIVGGAIDFIKELEQQLQSLEAQKLQHNQSNTRLSSSASQDSGEPDNPPPSLSHFFLHSHDMSQENKNGSRSSVRAAMADVDVTLIETHANIRILTRRRGFGRSGASAAVGPPLSKLVGALHTLSLSVLHLSVTTMDTSAVYSISTKVEESCQLSSVDDIAAAVHHMLSIVDWCLSIPEIPFDIS